MDIEHSMIIVHLLTTCTNSTRAGSLLLTGYVTPLDCLPVHTRELILQGWAVSRFSVLRLTARSLSSLIKAVWVRTSPTLPQILDFPKPAHSASRTDGYQFEFIQVAAASETGAAGLEILKADVVIVGSGCGGAVCAKTLSEAGLRVIVVEKSYYWSMEHLPMSESEGAYHLFENGGVIFTDDGSTAVVAGSTWGGGGTVNWSAALQTQGMVRREWSERFGLQYFASAAFQTDLDAVCDRMGVSTAAIRHNKTNEVLLEGARKLGWSAKAVPQNTGGEVHSCGQCPLGCDSGGKKGPNITFLPDAAKAGARFMEGFEVHEITFAEHSAGAERKVSGVSGACTSRDGVKREVLIKAPRVIVSAGTLASPLLLLRSGLTNPHIGRHLHLHPVSFLGAVWDQDVKPWEGSILTAVINEFEDLDGDGYGAKLEATSMLPSNWVPIFPWQSGLQFKHFAANLRRTTGYISLARDRYGGRVYPDPVDGRCRIEYSPSKHDRVHILEGVARMAEVAYVEGAREIFTAIPTLPAFVRPGPDAAAKIRVLQSERPSVTDVDFKDWLIKLRAAGLPSPDCGFASAHQMGTCRMGTLPSNSVVDPKGRVWGVEGLYVADASVFPSATGVNPMISNMAIARGIARGIVEDGRGVGSEKASL